MTQVLNGDPFPIHGETPCEYILRENLMVALSLAIETLEGEGHGNTAMCSGFRRNLKALQQGHNFYVKE